MDEKSVSELEAVEVNKLEVSKEERDALVTDLSAKVAECAPLVDMPGMHAVYLDPETKELVITPDADLKSDGVILARYGCGSVTYPATPAKQLAALEASILEDLQITFGRKVAESEGLAVVDDKI